MSVYGAAHVKDAAAFISTKLGGKDFPETAIVLGSGFKSFVEEVNPQTVITLSEIPYMPVPKVSGHGAEIIIGKLKGDFYSCALVTGRVHLYEGYSVPAVVFLTRALQACGVRNLVITNASGSVNPKVKAGTIGLIKDHINLTGQNCLAGTMEFGPQFVDMTQAYHREWRGKVAEKHADVEEVVYCGLLGPSYETPAETFMIGKLGADVVGMSTVQETLAARQLGVNVFGITLATNMAGGLAENVNHQEVLAVGQERGKALSLVLRSVLAYAPK